VADRRISELPVIPAVAGDDALAIVDTSLSETNKVSVEDLLRSAPAGTAAAPSIAFVDDPDTGFYRSAANELSISTSGSQRVVVDSAGLVGIGTSSPSATMHLRAANAQLRIQPTADSTQTGRIFFTDQNDNDKFSIQGGGVYGTELVFRSDTTERMRINSSGAIGIGTSSPTQILQLKGSDATLLIQDSANSFSLNQAGILLTCSDVSGDPRTDIQRRIRGDGDDLVFTYGASDTEQLRLTDGGNVGIGTSSPYRNLQVDDTTQPQFSLSVSNAEKLRFQNVSAVSYIDTIDESLAFRSGASGTTERMRIKSDGVINYVNCPTYADDSAAGTGGLTAGDVYKTSTGELRIKL